MMNKINKTNRIYDAVYGYIELDEVEFALVNSPIFQRLHWIKQLGPLHIIFPSAQHSRFSHSIGVFHIMTKMIKHLDDEKNGYKSQTWDTDKKALRFAALLHDIGHIPLSHIGETVLRDSFKPENKNNNNKKIGTDKPRTWRDLFLEEYRGNAKLHELLSVEIVLESKEIKRILENNGYKSAVDRENILKKTAKIIVGQHEDQVLNALLHSELDADRLDYLLRDSFFTGVGYGRVDLDYIISRIAIVKDRKTKPIIEYLCFENKGLHTIEHYILGRFFLQTQVVFNRKVRFLDLVFTDVMTFMTEQNNDRFHIMNLSEFLDCIKNKDTGQVARDRLHKIYAYTDAEVFTKMRELHEGLDKTDKDKKANEQESYINDCIKIIMDGDVPDPVGGTHQILVPTKNLGNRAYIKKLKEKSDQIAKKIAKSSNIHWERIKPNISEQPVMKYTDCKDEDENLENLKEAVRITYPTTDGNPEVRYAAKSNATILGGLVDKTLLVLNIYYVPTKGNLSGSSTNMEAVIKEGFAGFVSKYFQGEKMACGCDSGEHLCQTFFDENGPEKLKKLAKNPKFICSRCGRASSLKETLCEPAVIDS